MGVRTRGHDIAASLRSSAADIAARDEARRVVERWNQSLATGRDMWWSPTIRAALIAGTPWIDVYCPGCRTSRALDIRTIDRHPLALSRQPRAGAQVLVVSGLGTDAQDHRPSRAAASGNREAHGGETVPMEFMFGRPLSPEELEMIRSQIESMDKIDAVSDEVRGIVKRNWPHLVSKLPPEDK
jgi:hypothetical protein